MCRKRGIMSEMRSEWGGGGKKFVGGNSLTLLWQQRRGSLDPIFSHFCCNLHAPSILDECDVQLYRQMGGVRDDLTIHEKALDVLIEFLKKEQVSVASDWAISFVTLCLPSLLAAWWKCSSAWNWQGYWPLWGMCMYVCMYICMSVSISSLGFR